MGPAFLDVDTRYLVRQKKAMEDKTLSTQTYATLLASIKERIQSAQVRAALAVNRELVLLYWGIGKEILARQEQEGWGTKVIERLAKDLGAEFPQMKGLSRTNLFYMRSFAEAWPDSSIVQQTVGQIPWGHNVRLLDLVKTSEERLWYARAATENGWSRNMLMLHIEAKLFQRQGKAMTNFQRTLPSPQSDLAQQILKDPYNFDFLTLSQNVHERELEAGLVEHIRKFSFGVGSGVLFRGKPVPAGDRGGDVSARPAFLSFKASLLPGDRFERRGVPTGVHREDELLPGGGGRSAAASDGPAEHRADSMPDEKGAGGGIRVARDDDADGHRRVYASVETAG